MTTVKRKLIVVMSTIIAALLLAAGALVCVSEVSRKKAYAAATEVTVTGYSAQSDAVVAVNLSEKIITSEVPIKLFLNDKEISTVVLNTDGSSAINIYLPRSDYDRPADKYWHLRIPAGTTFGNYTITEEYNVYNLYHVNASSWGVVGQEDTTPITFTGVNAVNLTHGNERYYIALGAKSSGVNSDLMYNCGIVYATENDDIKGEYTLYGNEGNTVNVNKEGDTSYGLMLNYSLFGETAPTTSKRLIKVPAGTVWGGYLGKYRITNTFYLLYDGSTFQYRNDNPAEERTLELEGLTNQTWADRFIMTLKGGSGSGKLGVKMCDVSVKVDGEAKTAEMWDWGTQYAFYMPYTVLSPEGYHTLEIAEQNLVTGYKFAGVSLSVCDGEVVTPKTLERVGGIYHVGLSRYQVYFTDFGGSMGDQIGTVSITVLNTATNEEKTDDKFKTSALLAWQNDGDGSNAPVSMLMFNASDYPLDTEYKITVKAGKVGTYYIKEDVSFYIYNGMISNEKIKEEVKITSMVGVAQDYDNAETDEHLHRYLIYLNFDKEINYNKAYESLGDVTVTINGVEKTVGMVADELPEKRAFLVINYTDAPKESKNVITIKAGTVFSYCMLTEDFTVRTDGERVYTKLTEMSIEWAKETKDDKTTLKGAVQENLKRYLFYIQTDIEGLTDTMWNGNKCVVDADTENEREATIYYVGGYDGDDTSILVVLYFKDIAEGAVSVSQIDVHSITIKAGTILNGKDSECYGIKDDLTIWVGGNYIAENEADIPELPDGVFYVNQGIENKTLEYTATNIEDYIANASVVKLKAGAEKQTDNNVFFEMPDFMDYCKSLKIIGSNPEPKIKFRSVYTGEKDGAYEDVYLVFEIRSQMDYGNYWGTGMPIVRLRYSGFLASDSDEKDCLWFDFFTNGWSGTPQYATFTNKDFKLEAGEYYVEFGAVNTTDAQNREGLTFFVNVIQGDKQAYAECTMTGDYNLSKTGDVAIYQSPYKTALIDGDKDPNYNGVVSSFTLMSVDKEREIDGETVAIGAMSLYNPKIRVVENYDEYDISDIVPIGSGKTYTKIDGDTTSASQSMINATSVRTNNGGYSVKMKIKFTGDDFGCTFAFRGRNTHAKNGYTIIIADTVVIIGAKQVNSPFRPGETYEIEMGCLDFYIADERTPSGTWVYLKVNGVLVADDTIDRKTDLGTYFCGLVEGAGDSMVTVSSTKDDAAQPVVTIVSNKTIVTEGKRTSLSYTNSMPTAFDKVTYEVVSGSATIRDGALYSETNGRIVVRAKVTNEFGTFYSEEITLNADSEEGGSGCGSAVDGAVIALPLIAFAAIMIFRKKETI